MWPYGLWILCWIEIGRITVWSGHAVQDVRIVALDLGVFGVHLHERFVELFPAPALGEVMQAIYLSYYFLVLGPPLLLALRRKPLICERYTLALMTTYLVCFTVYLLYPVLGPRAAAAAVAVTPGDGGVAAWSEALRQLGDSPGTAFPSSHCAGSLAAALAAGRYVARPWALLLIAWAGLIAVSTIVTGNHYAIDAACGLAVAVGVHLVLARRGWIVTRREVVSCDRF